MEPTERQIDAFKRGWSFADEQGLEGRRVLHGLIEVFREMRVEAEEKQDGDPLGTARREYLRLLFEIPEGVEANFDESLEQLKALEQALVVHWGRTGSYGTVWRKWGPLSPLLSAAKKLDRLMETFWFNRGGPTVKGKPKTDDAVDAINYLAFFIRLEDNEA